MQSADCSLTVTACRIVKKKIHNIHLVSWSLCWFVLDSMSVCCCLTAKDKGEKKLFGYSFVPLMQEDGRTLPDCTHELIIHKVRRDYQESDGLLFFLQDIICICAHVQPPSSARCRRLK